MEDIRSLEDLLDLQAVDSEIDRLIERRGTLPALADYQAAHAEVARLDAEIAATSERGKEVDLAEDKAEGEMKLDEEKLEREERRLYAGGLSAREAEHLREEVAMLRKRVSTREDEALALIEEREAIQSTLDGLQAERATASTEEQRLEKIIQTEWGEIDAEVERLRSKRGDILPSIAPDLVELYDEIRPTKEGVAAVALIDSVCSGCHLKLSAAEHAQALKTSPPRCVHCRRILAPR